MNQSLGMLLALLALVFGTATNLRAGILFESGALGLTGVPRTSISDEIPASTISPTVFVGVRFHLDQPANVQAVGGHFVRNTDANSSFFGTVVSLDGEVDFPNSEDLSTPDVVGATLLSLPEPSAEAYGSIVVHLDPGWYALVFGSGLFGATGSGVALRNNVDIGDPSYIALEANLNWFNLDIFGAFFDNHRFVVIGEFVPEPNSIVMIVVATAVVMISRGGRVRTAAY